LRQEAADVIARHPTLFAPDTLAEAPLTASLDGIPLVGTIDRLRVSESAVLAIDFKSNLLVPTTEADVPDGLLRQMAAYYAALTQIYPDRTVQVALLWTRTGELMPLDANTLRAALLLTRPSLDAGGARPYVHI
jgi:ATP-dependent helicase/nuclease subunit A